MGLKEFFEFSWLKIIIGLIVAIISYNLIFMFSSVGGISSIFGLSSFFILIYQLSRIYILIIVIVFIVDKIKNRSNN